MEDRQIRIPASITGPGPVLDSDFNPFIERREQDYLQQGERYCEGFLSSFGGLRRFLAQNFLVSSAIDYHAARRALAFLKGSSRRTDLGYESD